MRVNVHIDQDQYHYLLYPCAMHVHLYIALFQFFEEDAHVFVVDNNGNPIRRLERHEVPWDL
jgi:hypothetical protein